MSDSRETERLVGAYLQGLPVPEGAKVDEKVLPDALMMMQRTVGQQATHMSRMTWRTIMTSNRARLATAAAIILVVALGVSLLDQMATPAWALEQAIEALKDFGAVHVAGAFPGGTAEIWMRANTTKTQSTDVVVRGSHGAITWTQDGSTYHYEPSQNTVYFEHAPTIGMAQWLGPELLEMLSAAETAKVVRGKDPATGRDRVMLMCSLIDVHGAQSWLVEFDAASKLPVAMKSWPNLDRSGPPSFDASKIVYYEDLPDSVFDVRIPGNATYVEKPLTIPDETVGALSNPRDGIPTEGMTQQEAAEKAVRMMYQAVIDQDLDGLKRICPLCRNWGDGFLRKIIFKPDKEDRIVEILEIGGIGKTGNSKLGPIAAVPTTVRLKNGKKAEQQMIVQFRQLGDTASCVVHGPYGLPREIE